jgi:CubicO group peptidase (beta-lactamase class C family)
MESNEELPPQALPSSAIEPFLASLFSEPPEGGRNTLAVVVMHKGDIIAERYALPVLPSTRLQGWSMNKSLMASFVGIQAERGLLDLDLPVRDQLSHSGVDSGLIKDLSPNLTLEHLLSMASGLDFEERYYPGDDVTEMLYGGGPMWQVPIRQGHRVPPGSEFVYSSGDTNVVSYLWQQSLAGEDYVDWLNREVYRPLELDRPVLEPDSSGVQVGSSFAYLTARDWARLGQWWLDAWHGRDELLSQVWQRGAVTPGVARGGDYYGLGFWLNTKQRKFPGVPENTFNAGGNSGQFVVVVPEAELVVVRLGLTLDESKVHLAPFLRQVLAQLESEARESSL